MEKPSIENESIKHPEAYEASIITETNSASKTVNTKVDPDSIKGIVYEKKYVLGFGIFFISLLPVSLVAAYYLHPMISIIGIFSFAFGIYSVLVYKYYRLEFDKNGFTYKNVFTKLTKYRYADITKIDTKWGDWKIYIGGQKIRLDQSHENREIFLQVAQGNYDNIPNLKKEIEEDNKKSIKDGLVILIIGIIMNVIYFTVLYQFENIYDSIFRWVGFGFVMFGIFKLFFRRR